MSHAPVTDYKAIRKVYHERLGGNPFGIEPNVPLKALVPCGGKCTYVYDPNDGTSTGKCSGFCSG
jgi:hypothetical protein